MMFIIVPAIRTTLTLDPEIHHAVRGMAREHGESIGAVVASLARAALRPRGPPRRLPRLRCGSRRTTADADMVRDALEDV